MSVRPRDDEPAGASHRRSYREGRAARPIAIRDPAGTPGSPLRGRGAPFRYTRAMLLLTPKERRELRALAHTLHPVVAIGHAGLTPQVLHEIDVALDAHELIKIRVHSDDRDAREAMLGRVCEELEAAPVQHLGKLLIVWRPAPPPEPARKRAPSGAGKGRPVSKAAPAPPPRERRRHREPATGERHARHRRGASRHGPAEPIAAASSSLPSRRRLARPAEPGPAQARPPAASPRGRFAPAPAPRAKAPGSRPPRGAKPSGPPASVRRRRRPTGRD